MAISEIIGFDLGHGEFAIAKTSLKPGADLQTLEVNNKTSQVTALGRINKSNGEIELIPGESAFIKFEKLNDFLVNFKKRPDNDPVYKKNMQDFFSSVIHQLSDKKIISLDQCHIFVGCPSEWTEDNRNAYEQIFKSAISAKISVVAESSAAMLNAKETGIVDSSDKTILVIDVGSSTTDFTFFSSDSYDKPINEEGDDLGAGMIDEAFLEFVINNHSKKDHLKAFLIKKPRYKSLWLYMCRLIKEKYFLHKEDYREPGIIIKIGDLGVDEHEDEGFIFAPKLDGPTVIEFLNKPLPGKKLSWIQHFDELLKTTHEKIVNKHNKQVDLVILTGGATKMDFIIPCVNQFFPESKVKGEAEKSLSVAKGLAYWGRWDYLKQEFLEQVNIFALVEIPSTFKNRSKNTFIENVAPELVKSIMDDIVAPKMKLWRIGRIKTIENLERDILNDATNYVKFGAGKRLIGRHLKDWFQPILNEINHKSDIICHQFNIRPGSLNIKLDIDIDEEIDGISIDLPEIIQSILSLIQTIVAVVIASLLGGGGMAILMSGPIGWLIGLGIGVLVVSYGREEAEKMIKGWEFPVIVIKMMLSEDDIQKQCKKKETIDKVELQIINALKEANNVDTLVEKIVRDLLADLNMRADHAMWQIK